MVIGFIFVALFPQWLAPYRFDQIVGTSFLAPGKYPDLPMLITHTESTIESLRDLAVSRRMQTGRLSVSSGVPHPPWLSMSNPRWWMGNWSARTPDYACDHVLSAMSPSPNFWMPSLAGEVVAGVANISEFAEFTGDYPQLRSGASLSGGTATAGGFTLGTNDIGQDVFSRLIWGTRVAILIGFSSSIISLLTRSPAWLIGWILWREIGPRVQPGDGQSLCFSRFDPGDRNHCHAWTQHIQCDCRHCRPLHSNLLPYCARTDTGGQGRGVILKPLRVSAPAGGRSCGGMSFPMSFPRSPSFSRSMWRMPS